jgi:hypothetical protein
MARSRTRVAIVAAFSIAGLLIPPGGALAATALPNHVYAPYFETWTADSLATVSQQSGVKHFTLAFLETTSKSSCTLAWDGDKTQPVSGGRYLSEVGTLRAAGGDLIPSLGGWSADQGAPRSATRARTSTRSSSPTVIWSSSTTSAGSTWTSRAGR